MNDDDAQKMAIAIATALTTVNAPAKAEIPAPLKWASGIISALLVMAIAGSGAWLINTVNDMQQTLARLDERSNAQIELQKTKDDDTEHRIEVLENAMHKGDYER